jgi:[citrate (pro-3S)-lyase] ligase
VFWDSIHYNGNGNKHISEKIFDRLSELDFFEDKLSFTPRVSESVYTLPEQLRKELTQYQELLSLLYNSIVGSGVGEHTIGTIVMNCNPFTLGHRYLIEQAAARCKYLFVFVVQEDKSDFKFIDRLEMVELGTRDLPNVTVLPSGKFIISSLTFEGYFNKSSLQDRVVDSSLDVTLFGREIAPKLHITKRFVGEEPLDAVTAQYNAALASALPDYGIELEIIPRIEHGGEVISASRVRKLLEVKDWAAIAEIVPESTLKVLKAKYN